VRPRAKNDYRARGFAALIDAYTKRRNATTGSSERVLRKLLNGYEERLSAWRKSEETSASDFNLLETLNIARDEIRHSRMLAWLLDYRIEGAGTHAQGKLGFSLFLQKLGLNMGYAKANYFVSREVKGNSSRVDVEISAIGQFIIHLENKIFSEEATNQADREDQTVREWRDLQRRAGHLRVKREHVHGFFVTLLGDKPSSEHFIPITWHQLADVFDEFAEQAKPAQVSLFAKHYAKALRWVTQQIAPYEQDEQREDSP